MKAFGKAHPEAAKLVCGQGDARPGFADMSPWGQLSLPNISQSLHCMPMIASHADHLPCLTYEAKLQEGTKLVA